MPILTLEGLGEVEVEDRFLSLSPEEQNAAVDEIAATLRSGRMGRGTAFAAGAADSLTVGAGDEMMGAIAAGMSGSEPEEGPQSILDHAKHVGQRLWQGSQATTLPVRGIAKMVMGDEDAQDAYATVRDQGRDVLAKARKDQPTAALAGNIAGGVAAAPMLPGFGAKAAASLPMRIGQGMVGGGVAGGTYGAASGEGVADRAVGGVIGAGTGALAGGAVETAMAGAQAAAPHAVRSLKKVVGLPDTPAKPTPITAANERIAQAAEFDIPLTRGQATGDAQQLANEEAMRHLARGRFAHDAMQSADKGQRAAIDNAIGSTGRNFARDGGEIVDSAFGAGEYLGQSIKRAAKETKKKVDDLYTAARQTPGAIRVESVKGLGARIRQGLDQADVVADDLTPRAQQALNKIDELENLSIPNDAAIKPGQGDRITAIKMLGLEQVRKNLVSLRKNATTPPDGAAAGQVIRQFDDWLDDLIDNNAIKGSDAALKAFKDARKAHRQYKRTFRKRAPGDDVGALMERMQREDVEPAEIARALFGDTRVGESATSTRGVKRIAEIFGKNSQEMDALRQGVWSRLTGLGGDARTSKGIDKLSNDMLAFVDGRGKETAKVAFSEEQLGKIRRLARVLKQTQTPASLKNPSKSGYAMERAIRDAGDSLGLRDNIVGQTLKFLREAVGHASNVQGAKAALRAPVPINRIPAAPAGAGLLTGQSSTKQR